MKGVDSDSVVLMAARASRVENQDAIDAAIVGMLDDPKENKDESIAALPIDDLIEKADGFAGIFPEHKYEIVKRLQARKHICGMTGDGVNDAPALRRRSTLE
ncbi:hypothetical protein IFM89_029735 [Coptis chinensis]|uniref:Plasma membrane H+-ATPase n=1 Tax=Coptis chinensis TaxID=261450 RepID=A0A835I707_9MAGN|nr:hypothetical protein IFM89_029735 [Coptis chinensis]